MARKMNGMADWLKNKLLMKNSKSSDEQLQEAGNKINIEDQIEALANGTTAITQGEVGAKLPQNLDGGLDVIANNFMAMIGTMTNILGDIDVMSDGSADTSRQLESISTSTSKVMTDLSATLEELTSTTMQLNSNVIEIADGAQEIDDLTKEGMGYLADLEHKMGQIKEDSSMASDRIMALNKASSEMEGIISVITGIAKQTNLLALNAAIEAARAGESGKGFAVVADEVRKLAASTQSSLGDIRGLIDQFNKESKEAVSIINTNNNEIEAGSGILANTTKTFNVISTRISGMVEKVKESSEATEQIASGSQEIASAAALQTESIGEIHTLSSAISMMATNMKDELSGIQIGGSTLELDLDEFDRSYKKISESAKEALRNEFNVKGKYVIGMIARLEPNKGHEYFINGLKVVLSKYPNAVVVIAGNGSMDHDLPRMVEQAGLGDRVRCVGYRTDVQVILSIIDLVVATSIKEGTPPRIILEAMAASKPMISTSVVGAKAILKNGKHGLLVDHGNVDQLASALAKMLDKPELATNFGQEARKHIVELYNNK